MYDLLYQVYCAKLTNEGSDINQETSLRKFIEIGKEKRLAESKSFGSSKGKTSSWHDEDNIIRYIAGGLLAIITLIYYVVLCFTVFDTSEEHEENLRKQARLK